MTDEAVTTIEAPIAPVTATRPETFVQPHSEKDSKIEATIQAHLDAFDGIETPVAEPKFTPAPAPKPVEAPAPVEEPAAEPAPEKPVEAVAPAPAGESTLPAAYIRTAKARGWTDEDISRITKQDPELALKTLERMHESRTKEINEWAELGRRARTGTQPVSAPVNPVSQIPAPVPSPVSNMPSTTLQPIDVKAMVEKFGNQELIEALAGPVNAAIQAVAPLMEQAKTSREQATRTQQEQLGKIVQDFFTAPEMKSYATVYGTAIPTLTKEQVDLRGRVLETADALIAGAAFQGRSLNVQEALSLAHDSVASTFKENIIREQLKTTLKKREKTLSLAPTAVGRPAVGGPPKSRQELVDRAEDRLAKAFA